MLHYCDGGKNHDGAKKTVTYMPHRVSETLKNCGAKNNIKKALQSLS